MNIQDDKLLRLYDYLKRNEFNRQSVADHLKITTRQLSRLIKKWEEEGVINYETGSGRGKNSTIEFVIDIEKEYLNELLKRMNKLSMEELGDIMKLPISEASKEVIQSVLEDMLYKSSVIKLSDISNHILIDYIYSVPSQWDPLKNSEVATAMILFNTMDSLYSLDANNEVQPNLVIYDEWDGNDLIIHLHREIRFTNGHLLTAEDVVASLERLLHHENHKELYKNIIDIEVLGTYTLKISMKRRMYIIKYLLTDVSASICKLFEGKWIGTGCYYVSKQSEQMIHLKINPYINYNIPDIEEVILVSDNKRYQDFYTSVEVQNVIDANAERLMFYLLNPTSNRLSLDTRKSLSKALIEYHEQSLPQDSKKHMRLFDTLKEALVDHEINPPKEPIRFLHILYGTLDDKALFSYLEDVGFNIELVSMNFADYVHKDASELDIDVILMHEIVPSHHMFYHLLHQSKLRDLFSGEQQTYEFNYIYEHCHQSYWNYAEEAYMRYLKSNYYIVPISRVLRSYLLRAGYKNMTINSYGIVEYGSIVAVK